MSVAARLFDGKTAKAQPVLLTLAEDRLYVTAEDGAPVGDWALAELRDENRPLREDELRLSLDHEEGRIVVTDIAFVEQLRHLCPTLQKRRSAPKGWWRPYAFWGGGAVLSVVLIFTVILPLLAGQVARLLPMETREQIGSQATDFIVQSIARRNGTTPEAVTCSNPEAEAVLQNVAHNHPTRLFVTNAGVATVLSILLGDVTGGTFLAALGQMTLGSGYSRDFEREADQSAIERMQAAGLDVSPMANLMQKLGEQPGSESFLSFLDSHPGFEERVATLTAAGDNGSNALSETEWAVLQGFCK